MTTGFATCEEGDPTLFRDLGVPRSTAASWIRRGQRHEWNKRPQHCSLDDRTSLNWQRLLADHMQNRNISRNWSHRRRRCYQ
jgi:hypothetical protein